LSAAERPVGAVDCLAGAGRTHPVASLLMVLFLFSLIGIPLTAGFAGKMLLFFDAIGLSRTGAVPMPDRPEEAARLQGQLDEQADLLLILAVSGARTAAA